MNDHMDSITFVPRLSEVLLQVLRFSPILKTNISKFQFDPESEGHKVCQSGKTDKD